MYRFNILLSFSFILYVDGYIHFSWNKSLRMPVAVHDSLTKWEKCLLIFYFFFLDFNLLLFILLIFSCKNKEPNSCINWRHSLTSRLPAYGFLIKIYYYSFNVWDHIAVQSSSYVILRLIMLANFCQNNQGKLGQLPMLKVFHGMNTAVFAK